MRGLISTVAMVSIASSAFAQGTTLVKGNIKDAGTSETLIGATVSIREAGKTENLLSTLTDVDGNFEFHVKPGNYTIVIESMGYQPKEITDIMVVEGKPVSDVVVAMSENKATELKEVVVTSTYRKETVNALYTMQKNAVAVSDGISAEAIKRSPDRNTGDVLKRVSGTTIQDNKFVVVRGLNERYNTGMVDNAILPSTEPNRKAFSFDIIPSSVVDNIVITKAGTPDLPGDFAGGVINILTKEVPEENYNNISIGASYNTVSTFKDFKTGFKSSTDFLGFDNGRQLPASFPKTTLNNLSAYESAQYLKMLNNDYSINTRSALPGMSLQAGMGRLYRLKNSQKFGFSSAITYNHGENIRPNILRVFDDNNTIDNMYNYSTSIGGLLNLGYYFTNSKIGLKTLYNRNFDDNLLVREGSNLGSSKDLRYYAFDLIQKSLFKTTLNGEHQIGSKQSKLDWLASFNYITNNQPDQKKVSYGRLTGTNDPFIAEINTLGKANNRLFSKLDESVTNAQINYLTPLNLFNKSALKTGLFGQYRNRDFKNRYLGATISTSGNQDILTDPIEKLYSNANIDGNNFNLIELYSPSDKYKATTFTSGAYAMLDNKFTEKLRLVWGARFEAYKVDLQTDYKKEVDEFWWDVLPSANLTYALNDKMNLRASYFRSLARPELREMANMSYYDYEMNMVSYGNPSLKRSTINNFDLRYEYFLGNGEMLSASVFYKNFNNTLEYKLYGQNSGREVTIANFPKADNIGAELELRKRLGFLGSDFLDNFTFYFNVAYIHSRVQLASPRYINGILSNERPLSGQSPYLVNTSLSYRSSNEKLNLTAMYNIVGQRIYLVGDQRFGDVYESPRNLLDFQASYALSKRSEIRLNVKDILNSKYHFYFDQDADGKFSGVQYETSGALKTNRDWILQEYRPGTSISLSYSYKF